MTQQIASRCRLARRTVRVALAAIVVGVASGSGAAASSPTAGVSAWTAIEAIPPAVARSSAAYCRDARLIAVRGTNDNLNSYGWIGSKIGGALVARARTAGVTYGGHGLPYPARAPSLRGYVESKNTGRDMLRAFIRVEVSTCPEQKLVLVGYSQGAHVVADVLSRGPSGRLTPRELSRIGAVVLIGDPRFNPDEPFTFGSFDVNRRGRLGARSPHDLDKVNGRIRAWCRRGDYWCQKPLPFGVSVRQAFAEHKQESYWADYKDAIVDFIAAKLGWMEPAVRFSAVDPCCDLGSLPEFPDITNISVTSTSAAVTFSVATLNYPVPSRGGAALRWHILFDIDRDRSTGGPAPKPNNPVPTDAYIEMIDGGPTVLHRWTGASFAATALEATYAGGVWSLAVDPNALAAPAATLDFRVQTDITYLPGTSGRVDYAPDFSDPVAPFTQYRFYTMTLAR